MPNNNKALDHKIKKEYIKFVVSDKKNLDINNGGYLPIEIINKICKIKDDTIKKENKHIEKNKNRLLRDYNNYIWYYNDEIEYQQYINEPIEEEDLPFSKFTILEIKNQKLNGSFGKIF